MARGFRMGVGGGGLTPEYYTYRITIPVNTSGTYPFYIERWHHKGDVVVNDIPYQYAGNYDTPYNDGILSAYRNGNPFTTVYFSNVSGKTSRYISTSGSITAQQGYSAQGELCIPLNFSFTLS